ncbi:MAG: hypothetical protein LBF01_00230, partial [Bacteroidales bacterium]|nr:hypothetical protein [Bacteroidales bacterium]
MKKLFLAVAVLCLTIPVSAQTANRLSLMSAKTAPLRENPNVQYVQKAQSEPTVNSAQMTTEFVCAYPIHHLYLGQSEPTVNNNTQMTTLFHETFNNGIRNGKWNVDSSTTNILYYTTVSPMAKTVPDTAQVFAFYPAGGLSTKPNYADPFARLVSNWIKLNGAENCWAYFDWLYEASNAPNSNISLGIAMRTSPGAEWTPVAHEIGGTTLTGNKKFGTPESSSGKIPTEMASADSIQLCVFLGHSTSQTLQFMFYFDNIKIVSFGGQTDGPKADLAVKSPGTITESATTFKTTATVTNQSDIPIKSLVIASKLNDGNVQYQQITIDPEIGVLSSLEIFVDLLGLTNDNIGTNNFVYWISQINNFSFEPETVGRTECSVYIPNPNDAVYPIKYLVEHFTSSTCGPCAPNNVTMNPFYDAQEAAGKLIFVKYQMNWPGTGDPYYVAQDGGVRRNYYAVNAVPMMFGNAAVKENKDEMTADITKLEGKKAYMG